MGRKPLFFHRPTIEADDIRAVADCLRSGWLTTGPRTAAFEQAFSKYVGGRHAVAVNSCTAAIHLALLALKIGPGDEVITSPVTFASAVNMIVHVGAVPVFADVDPESLTLNPSDVEKKLTHRTRAVMPVHFAGHPCEMHAILRLAKRFKLAVIADAAHAIEARYRGRPLGGLGDVVCYSFYATKNLTTGEGGMAVTGNARLAQTMRTLRLHGMSRDAWKRYLPGEFRHWDILEPGWKYNMSDVQAALGLTQLRKVGKWLARRRKIVRMYERGLRDLPVLKSVRPHPGDRSAWHLYVLLLDSGDSLSRDQLLGELQAQGIGVGVHFRAVHETHYYAKKYGFKHDPCPVAEDASRRLFSLPLYPTLSDKDVARVIKTVRRVLGA